MKLKFKSEVLNEIFAALPEGDAKNKARLLFTFCDNIEGQPEMACDIMEFTNYPERFVGL